MTAGAASECPNCRTDTDDAQDCPHLLEGDDCPECGNELHKPRAGKVRCERCFYVVNGRNNDTVLDRFGLSYREARRLLRTLGHDHHGTPGSIGNKLYAFCHEEGVDVGEFRATMQMIRGGDGS